MKRRREEDGEECDCLLLQNFADVLLCEIFSHLNFCERASTRRVCRAFRLACNVLPPPETLELMMANESRDETVVTCDKTTVRIEFAGTMPLLRLKDLRPTRLHLFQSSSTGVLPSIVEKLGDILAVSVKSLWVKGLATHCGGSCCALTCLNAFHPFRENLTELHLETSVPLSMILVGVSTLQQLVKLDLELVESQHYHPERENGDCTEVLNFPFLQLQMLNKLPKLRELRVEPRDTDYNVVTRFVTGFILGVMQITQLKVFTSPMLIDWEVDRELFGDLLDHLDQLEEIHDFYYPSASLWDVFHRSGGHKGIRKMGLYYSEPTEQDLQAMSVALVRDFPELVSLDLEMCNMHSIDGEHLPCLLSALNGHPNLKTVSCHVENGCHVDSAALQEALNRLDVR